MAYPGADLIEGQTERLGKRHTVFITQDLTPVLTELHEERISASNDERLQHLAHVWTVGKEPLQIVQGAFCERIVYYLVKSLTVRYHCRKRRERRGEERERERGERREERGERREERRGRRGERREERRGEERRGEERRGEERRGEERRGEERRGEERRGEERRGEERRGEERRGEERRGEEREEEMREGRLDRTIQTILRQYTAVANRSYK